MYSLTSRAMEWLRIRLPDDRSLWSRLRWRTRRAALHRGVLIFDEGFRPTCNSEMAVDTNRSLRHSVDGNPGFGAIDHDG